MKMYSWPFYENLQRTFSQLSHSFNAKMLFFFLRSGRDQQNFSNCVNRSNLIFMPLEIFMHTVLSWCLYVALNRPLKTHDLPVYSTKLQNSQTLGNLYIWQNGSAIPFSKLCENTAVRCQTTIHPLSKLNLHPLLYWHQEWNSCWQWRQ